MTNASDLGKKKILYVITKSNFGGAQMYVYDLATHMKQQGHDVTVACGPGGTLIPKLEAADIRVHIIYAFERDVKLRKELRSWWELFRVVRNIRPDIIHTNSPKAGGSAAFVARLCRVPHIIYTAHGWPFFEQRSWLWRTIVWGFSYLTVLLSHRIICVSQHDYTAHRFPHKKKFYVIHNGVTSPILMEREKARAELTNQFGVGVFGDVSILSVAELNDNKNIAPAIEAVVAVNQSSEQSFSYVVMGDGEQRAKLEALVTAHHAQSYIHLLGFVDNPFIYLNAFDIFMLPSKKEGLPYALLFANAAGVPLIGTNIGGIPDIINKTNGILLDTPSRNAIEIAIQTISQPENLKRYSNNPHRPHFPKEAMLEKTMEIYGLRSPRT